MKPKRFYFRSTPLFGTPLRYGVPVIIGFAFFITEHTCEAAIFGGSTGSASTSSLASGVTTGTGTTSTNTARDNASELLNRSNQAVGAALALQQAARAVAISGANHLGTIAAPLPNVTNGLGIGGLQIAPAVTGDPTQWTGANLPVQTVSNENVNVTIKQTTKQASLNWQTFNVGKKTIITFDQSAGGENVSQWIVFNKINDPTGNPTQILGSIKAEGQVYLINCNGIIFGGSSQVNARGLTASSLPMNHNLISRGLLNNPDAQFLFSGLSVPGGTDGTPNFDPGTPPATGHYGDVIVQAGAVLTSPVGSGGNGGRIMLVGPNVTNAGTISTTSGQAVIAAGLQVGVAAHNSSEPSLRGLDVWIGAVGDYAGTASNSGVVEALTGSVWMSGRHVNQLGVIDSSTSVNLNGRIDLKASYGAVGNPNFDSTTELGAGGPIFFNQFTGVVTVGEHSIARILPDYASAKAVPGTALPERSRINVDGLAVHFDKGSILLAPNAEVSVRAGVWPYHDVDGNRTIFDASGKVESGIANYYSGTGQRFFLNDGQIYVDELAVINVAGSVDVYVPLAQSVLSVKLLGPELADSPLQRNTELRGKTLTVDIRNTGIYNGKFWIGTPLGDVTGLAGLIERNAAQLTVVGGNINLQAGGSIVVSKTAMLDVSGGYFSHEGGIVKTSSLISGGRLVAIQDATPDQFYDGVFEAHSVFAYEKWGIIDTFSNSLFNGTKQESYVEGAAGGSLSLSAPSMALDGELRGLTVIGPRQRSSLPGGSALHLKFESEKEFQFAGETQFIKNSPTPPALIFSKQLLDLSTPTFSLVNDRPNSLAADRRASVILTSGLLGDHGFGALEIANPDGSITVQNEVTLSAAAMGSVSFAAANISIFGAMNAAGGKLSFTTYNLSPSFVSEYGIVNRTVSEPYPSPVLDRGHFTLAAGASLSTAGFLIDDSSHARSLSGPQVIGGGSITIHSYQALLAKGAGIDVSGGAYVSASGKISYGKGGSISILTGKDPAFLGLIGGNLVLDSTLSAYSGISGGILNLQANLIRVGGISQAGFLNLGEDFFQRGGFAQYSLTGIGAASAVSAPTGIFESYIPAIAIAAGAQITPHLDGLAVVQNSVEGGTLELSRFEYAKGVRSAVNLSFSALGSDDPFTLDQLEVRGDILMGEGARISTEAGGKISFKGGTVTLFGSVIAPGGEVSVAGAGSFPLTTSQKLLVNQALPTVHLGAGAQLDTAGITQLVPDHYGRRVGIVYDGGKISISGNILTESGAVLDVSGTSGILDLNPLVVANQGRTGLSSIPLQLRGIATQIDSNGGVIDLTGSQMLLSDATLRGGGGGVTATGGNLSWSSGRFYPDGVSRTGADVNLTVKQSGSVIKNPSAVMGVGVGLVDQNGQVYGNSGVFVVDRFMQGGFASLSLGGKYVSNAAPIPYGGNLDFQGKIDLSAKGQVRLAAGGVIHANDDVKISASYLSLGQDFLAPQHPEDLWIAFQRDPALPSSEYHFSPSFGSGSLDLNAKLIDVGTLSLQNIGRAKLTAIGGDIRGNGTLSMAGDLVLKAAQIYPTTLGKFDIFVYDHAGIKGSVTIQAAGKNDVPLAAGGSLSIYSSNIFQSGVLRAPLGTIRLGWDGSDLDKSDLDIDAPQNLIAGSSLTTPVTNQVVLTEESVISVSARGLEIPYGMSPDGLTWIDPRGVNITLSGLPGKAVFISGDRVRMDSGATVDIRGGGDLFSTRWIPGNGGSKNLLGTATGEWGTGTEYQAGALVVYLGETWSARVRHSGQRPGANIYWSKLAESFAIVPSYTAKYTPYGGYNTGTNAASLAGNPGYVNRNLKVGDTINLEASDGLAAGTYTLLPRGYAALKGGFLITPMDSESIGALKTADGATFVSGYLANAFNPTDSISQVRSRFEVASADVLKNRATYTLYSANDFMGKVGSKPLLPTDAGYAAFHGNIALQLAGSLLTQSSGRGAAVDISSFSEIHLIGGKHVPVGTQIALQTHVLNSWGVASLLVGGVRSQAVNGSFVDVRTNRLIVDNPEQRLLGPELILASRGELTLTEGSSLASEGKLIGIAQNLLVTGDGTLLRVSSDLKAEISRSGVTGSATPLMNVGASASIVGPSVILDSSYGTILSPLAQVDAKALTLASGQISVVFDDAGRALAGSVVNSQLTLAGVTLDKIQQSKALTLLSYRSIDFYGTGSIGSNLLEQFTLSGSDLRNHGQGSVVIRAKEVSFDNSKDIGAKLAPVTRFGSLKIEAETIHLGKNHVAVSGYQDVSLNASSRILFEGTGAFSTSGNLTGNTPLITGAKAATYVIHSAQAVSLTGTGATAVVTGELGASLILEGASMTVNTDILLPSGQLTLRAVEGLLKIGGNLSVAGSLRMFNEQQRFSNAGMICLESTIGSVILSDTANVSVAAAVEGGNAGTLRVNTPQGVFSSQGKLHGEASISVPGNSEGESGKFLLDVGSLDVSSLASFNTISAALDGGGFNALRNFRIRNGDVTIANKNRSHEFSLSTDLGGIHVTGTIDASGKTGGTIFLSARGDLTLAAGSKISVAADHFNSAGKGGAILLEAGTQLNGAANQNALLDLQSGSEILLGVNDLIAGLYTVVGSSAAEGKFTGTLHLRAPRTVANDDVRIDSIESKISGASAVVVEAFQVYSPFGGILDIAQRNQIHTDAKNFLGEAGMGNGHEVAMRNKLLTGAVDMLAIDSLLVISPGVEIVNLTGDLTLGLTNNTNVGSSNVEALASADWDLSGFRYGSRSAPGVLTLRANGNLVFNNTLSDGFTPIAQGSGQVFSDNGNSLLWLGKLMKIQDKLPTNIQSWSYRLTAGADLNASNFRNVLSGMALDVVQPLKGSVIVGEFYPAVPNSASSGLGAATGSLGQTADSIRISTSTADRGNRFEVVRTGTGEITISAGRDVQLRNVFSTIYTAGVALPTATTIYSENDFVLPVLPTSVNSHPSQSGVGSTLGSVQQLYPATWSMAGGDITITAQANIGRYTMLDGVLSVDSSRELPSNWLYRRGYVDTTTGLFAKNGGFGVNPNLQNSTHINDSATSTTWWIDYSNFFEGVGALGGGNVSLVAGSDIVNVDAVAPTNARMPGRKKNPDFNILTGAPEYLNLAADAGKLLELGGGDVTVTAGRNIEGGVYYVEKGKGILFAGGEITTNAARSPSLGILNGSAPLDPLTWLPTTLFVGKSQFEVAARGDVLLGPVSNAFILPQGINNKFWYKTYFNTYSANAGATVVSYGGDVTHRAEVTLPGQASASSILSVWLGSQNLFSGDTSLFNASNYQPWLRLSEMDLASFGSILKLSAPNLSSVALGGDLNLVGSWTLAPSATGNFELMAAGNIVGLQNTGPGTVNGKITQVWTSSSINISDAAVESLPGIGSPLAYQSFVGRTRSDAVQSKVDALQNVNFALRETASSSGVAATGAVKQALHASGVLHVGDVNPVRLYATGGDITGLTLFSPKVTRIMAQRDVTDIAFYLQNVSANDVSLVSAGRDLTPFNENSVIRALANNLIRGNAVGDIERGTVVGSSSSAMAGDVQINGPGVLEVFSGRDLDLGTGANFTDGTGVGITSIGNTRNPNLAFGGADIIALAGVSAVDHAGPAGGLAASALEIDDFIAKYLKEDEIQDSAYLKKRAITRKLSELNHEERAIVTLEVFYKILRDSGRTAVDQGNYDKGNQAVFTLFGKDQAVGEIFTRAREIRTTSGGSISLAVPGGGITMASAIFGNPLTPPGIVTEYGGAISTFTNGDVSIGQARIFTLRGGDIAMWSSHGNIAAGTAAKTVVTAPPTRVLIDVTSADVQTDLGGLATGGGIGVLAAVEGVTVGNVDLIAPEGFVDAGDAGIRVTGNLNIAAQVVLNGGNISAGGTSVGAAPAGVSTPSISSVTSASNSSAAVGASMVGAESRQSASEGKPVEEALSIITVEVIGYGGGNSDEEEKQQ